MRPYERLTGVDRNLLLYSGITLFLCVVLLMARLAQRDLLMAAFMAMPISVCIYVSVAVVQRKHVEFAANLLCSMVLISIIAAVCLRGPSLLVWLFPVIFTLGFVLPVRTARLFSALTFVITLPIVWSYLPFVDFLRFQTALLISMIFSLTVTDSNAREADYLKALSRLDPLTKVGNRRSLERSVRRLIENNEKDYCMAIIDIDWFKRINDEFGHLKGDEILQLFCDVVKQQLPSNAQLYRYGGEEFVVLLPYGTSRTMEYIQTLLEDVLQYDFGLGYELSFSAGVAPLKEKSFEQWLAQADEVLFEAKQDGRCRVYRAT